MNDSPGWASPGSAPSDGQEPNGSGTARPPERPADQGGTDRPEPPSKWSKAQPPPASGPRPAPRAPAPPRHPRPAPAGAAAARPAPAARRDPADTAPGAAQEAQGPRRLGRQLGRSAARRQARCHPLRPLGVGEILDGAVSTMRTYWRTVLGISLTVAVVTQIAVILLQGFFLDDAAGTDALDDPSATVGELTHALGDVALGSGVVLLITLLGTIVATALLTSVTSRAVLGKSVTASEAWRDARPRLLRLFGLTFLLPLLAGAIIGVGVLPGVLVAIAGSSDGGAALAVLGGLGAGVVALWLMVRFSLASPALMLEKQGVLKSMTRSAKLVRGSWWRIFGIQLLATIIANIVASIVVIPFSVLAAALSGDGISGFLNSTDGNLGWTFLVISGIGSVIGSMLTFPITAGVTVLLYIDQRIRREALDLDLARAAGVSDYGSHAPGTTAGS